MRERDNSKGKRQKAKRQFKIQNFAFYLVVLPFTFYLLPSLWSPDVAACPWCKGALFSPGEAAAKSGLAKGYALSIAALLGIPLLLVGGIAFAVIRSMRHAPRETSR